MKRRPFSKNLLLVFAASLAVIVVAEIVVRVLHLAPEVTALELDTGTTRFVSVDDPILRYVPKPASHDISAYGIRDYEHTFPKPPGTYRIVVIGDSIAFGYCTQRSILRIDQTFPKVLERRLNAGAIDAGQKFEVINLGVAGYDTPQEVRFLEQKGLVFEPDLVLVAYCLNDSWSATGGLAELHRTRRPPSVLYNWLFHQSSLLRFTWQRLQVLQSNRARAKPGASAAPRSTADAGNSAPKSFQEKLGAPDDRVDIGFARLQELARTRGFDVVTVVFPFLAADTPYEYQSEHEAVSKKAAARGFHHLDLLEAFLSHDYQELQGACNRLHPGEKGHAVAAEAIEEFIRRNVPALSPERTR